jgi:hypothetical protein
MTKNTRGTRISIVAALGASMFALAAAQASITLTGDDRFMSASATLFLPNGSGSFSGPFTRTPDFGVDQFGSVAAGAYRDGCEIYVQNFQDSMVRSDFVKAEGRFKAGAIGRPGYTGVAKIVNRVEYKFTLNAGDFWQAKGTTSGNAYFELYDPNGTLLLANSGIVGGAAITSGTYRLVAGDNANGMGEAKTPGGPELFEGSFDVRFEIIPTPSTVALGGMVGMMTLGTRRRRN